MFATPISKTTVTHSQIIQEFHLHFIKQMWQITGNARFSPSSWGEATSQSRQYWAIGIKQFKPDLPYIEIHLSIGGCKHRPLKKKNTFNLLPFFAITAVLPPVPQINSTQLSSSSKTIVENRQWGKLKHKEWFVWTVVARRAFQIHGLPERWGSGCARPNQAWTLSGSKECLNGSLLYLRPINRQRQSC